MTREEVIAIAEQSGMKAGIGKTVKEKGKADVYHPDVNALGKSVPVEWLERFAILVEQKKLASLAADVSMPEPVGDGYSVVMHAGDTPSTMRSTRISVVGVETFTADQLRDYGDRRAAAEREQCRAACEAIADEYQRTQGMKYPELKDDAETGANDCESAIHGRNQLGGV